MNQMLASYCYVASQKTVNNKTLHVEYSSKSFGLRLLLIIYLMKYVYMLTKISVETLVCYKKSLDIVKIAHFTLVVKPLKILREYILL